MANLFMTIAVVSLLALVAQNSVAQDLGGLLKGILKEATKDVTNETAPSPAQNRPQSDSPSNANANAEFMACIEQLKRIAPASTDKELNSNESWQKECRQHRHSINDWSYATKVVQQKKDEIESYRSNSQPQKIYAECLGYIESIEPVSANKHKLMISSEAYEGTFPQHCSDGWGLKYPPSKDQYEDIESKRRAKLAIVAGEIRKGLAATVKKHQGTIAGLGIPPAWLKSTIVFPGKAYRSLEDWLSLVLENRKVKSVAVVRLKGNYGITIKVPQKPTEGFVFRKDDNELYPSHYVTGSDAVQLSTEDEVLGIAIRMHQIAEGN